MAKTGMPQGMRNIMGWVLGIGVIAFILLIMVIIFGNLSGNVGFGQESTSFFNETIALSDTPTIPATADNKVNAELSSIIVTNTTGGETIPATNYTVVGVTFVVETGQYNGTNVNISAIVTHDEQGKIDADSIILNYTKSAGNISGQLPTVGTIVGIAILLLILIGLLIFAITKMMGLSGTSGLAGNGSSKNSFEGSSREFS